MSERLRLTHDGKLLINGVDYLKDEQSVEMYTSTQHSSHMGDEVNTKADPRNCYGASIRTYTGKMFDFENPTADMLDINDIANALAMQPRYTGHIPVFYCHTPNTKVLTADMRWIRIGDVKEGDELLGFDEYPDKIDGRKYRSKRKTRDSKVTNVTRITRPVYKFVLNDGTELESSTDHLWLIATKKSRNQVWLTTQQIVDDLKLGRRRYMLRYFNVWEEVVNNDSGYLSGIFDGEGHISFHYGSVSIGFAQNEGVVLNKVITLLDKYGISYSTKPNPRSNVINIVLRGKWQNKFQFLGMFRPERLLDKLYNKIITGEYRSEFPSLETLEITTFEYLGEQEVVAIETTSKTFFAEGFASHNCVAQHATLMSFKLPTIEEQKMALLHEGFEAYGMDLSSPLKSILPDYRKLEDNVMSIVAEKFGLEYPFPPSIKEADYRMYTTESKFFGRELDYSVLPDPYDDMEIIPWNWKLAKRLFLTRYYELFYGKRYNID